MGTLLNANSNTTATAYTAATEVAAITSVDSINTLDASNNAMEILVTVSLTPGATGGTVVAKVHQGSGLTGATVATVNLSNTVASTPYSATFLVIDTAPLTVGPGNAGVPLYTASLTVAGSTGTGSFASIAVFQGNDDN